MLSYGQLNYTSNLREIKKKKKNPVQPMVSGTLSVVLIINLTTIYLRYVLFFYAVSSHTFSLEKY